MKRTSNKNILHELAHSVLNDTEVYLHDGLASYSEGTFEDLWSLWQYFFGTNTGPIQVSACERIIHISGDFAAGDVDQRVVYARQDFCASVLRTFQSKMRQYPSVKDSPVFQALHLLAKGQLS